MSEKFELAELDLKRYESTALRGNRLWVNAEARQTGENRCYEACSKWVFNGEERSASIYVSVYSRQLAEERDRGRGFAEPPDKG